MTERSTKNKALRVILAVVITIAIVIVVLIVASVALWTGGFSVGQ
jgi:hypothetical protein